MHNLQPGAHKALIFGETFPVFDSNSVLFQVRGGGGFPDISMAERVAET